MLRSILRRWDAALPLLAFGMSGPAFVQSPAIAQPVVQSVPAADRVSLNAALARLGRNPRDIDALIDAGNAALGLGDVDAAVGFFARAEQISPENARVKAGLAGALVRSDNPYDAIPMFAEAEAKGGMDARLAADRGLAYDLVGDNGTAQRYYRQALAFGPSDEATRRLALSQAIAGDRTGMEITLAPLLQRQDKAAWRTRAFALAIGGKAEDGVSLAYQTMPQALAAGIAPYLRYMPRLTRAQQAAAATFGHFPRAADIGRDDPRVAAFALATRVATADTGLIPKGEPLGRKGASAKPAAKPPTKVAVATPPRAAPPELAPTRETTAAPALASSAPQVAPPPVKPPAIAAAAAAPTVTPAASASPRVAVVAPSIAAPGTALAQAAARQAAPAVMGPPASVDDPRSTVAVPQPTAAAPPVLATRAPAPTRVAPSFSDAFGDLGGPVTAAVPAAGAVDVTRIAVAKPAAKVDPKAKEPVKPKEPPKPAHPSRIWVQVGVGRDKAALGFTWRDLAKDNAALFRGQSPWLSDWGRTNRLLAGPFESQAAATAFLARAKKAGVDSFVWSSPAGQVVDPLGGR